MYVSSLNEGKLILRGKSLKTNITNQKNIHYFFIPILEKSKKWKLVVVNLLESFVSIINPIGSQTKLIECTEISQSLELFLKETFPKTCT